MEFWRRECLEMLAGLDEWLAEQPCYIVPRDEISLPEPPGCAAFTGRNLSTALENVLRQKGEWKGPSQVAMVINVGALRNAAGDSACPSYIEAATKHIAIHEAAHAFTTAAGNDEQLHPTVVRTLQRAVEGQLPTGFEWPDGEADRPPWHAHGSDFVRAGIHLAHRANANGFVIDLEYCNIAGPTYGLSSVADYEKVLGGELDRSDERLASILSEPPLAAFAALFSRDTSGVT